MYGRERQMFSDSDCTCEEVHPALTADRRSTTEASTQSANVGLRDNATETTSRESKEVQTESSLQDVVVAEDYDIHTLRAFLSKVLPGMLLQLTKNTASRAFDHFNIDDDDEHQNNQPVQLHTLSYNGFSNVSCTGLSWNATGSAIAVSYGHRAHDGWCTDPCGVCIWNLNRRNVDVRQPHHVLEAPFCISCIQFHPKIPAVLAGGGINGNVLIWNINNDENPLVHFTKTDDEGHSDMVSIISWILDPRTYKYLLLTAGLDGKILLWQVHDRKLDIHLIKGYLISTDFVPRTVQLQYNVSSSIGIVSLDFICEDPSMFIVGVEGGGVFQCSLESSTLTGKTLLGLPLISPIIMAFQPCQGFVNAIACSPFNRNAFVTCASNGELRFFSLLQPHEPILTFHVDSSLQDTKWSTTRPLVFGSTTADGHFLLYDLTKETNKPFYVLPVESQVGITKLQFNHANATLVASGGVDGHVQIWRLNKESSTLIPHELDFFHKNILIEVVE